MIVAALAVVVAGCTTHSRCCTDGPDCTLVYDAHIIAVVLDGLKESADGFTDTVKFHAARSSDFKNSTDYLRELAIRGMNPAVFTYFGGAGVPTCTSNNPYDFGPENNAWCLVADQDQVTNLDYPMFFTRNAVQTIANGRTNWVLADVEPLGTNMCICLTQNGAILRLEEKDIQSWSSKYPDMRILRP